MICHVAQLPMITFKQYLMLYLTRWDWLDEDIRDSNVFWRLSEVKFTNMFANYVCFHREPLLIFLHVTDISPSAHRQPQCTNNLINRYTRVFYKYNQKAFQSELVIISKHFHCCNKRFISHCQKPDKVNLKSNLLESYSGTKAIMHQAYGILNTGMFLAIETSF